MAAVLLRTKHDGYEYLKIRGHYTASTWMEQYKRESKKCMETTSIQSCNINVNDVDHLVVRGQLLCHGKNNFNVVHFICLLLFYELVSSDYI